MRTIWLDCLFIRTTFALTRKRVWEKETEREREKKRKKQRERERARKGRSDSITEDEHPFHFRASTFSSFHSLCI